MSMSYQKVKSVAKVMTPKGPKLEKVVLETMKLIADMVGATLGPGGMQVLIERQELNLPPMITKDGVTVFRSLGFDDATAHVVMEAARDCSIRTANTAGDGTTTATVLADAIVRFGLEYTKKNPKVSPQKVVKRLMWAFKNHIEPTVKGLSRHALMGSDDGRKLLWDVAKISANGDTELADAVLQCFDVVGDDGNVTITEMSGPSGFEVEHIEGYPIGVGYEDTCGKYSSKFITDPGVQRTIMENPLFCVYHGKLTEIQTVAPLMEKIGAAWQADGGFRHNVVLVATGFSESVLAQLAINMAEMTSINVFPLLAPLVPVPGGQLGVLEDICAYTGARLLDPLNNPMDRAETDCLGTYARTFEANRFRSIIVGETESEEVQLQAATSIEARVDILKEQKKQAASVMDASFFEERIGKLTGGIAKLKVIGASNGELRERRDRAEDAICAVRGAIAHGCIPGGGWALLKIADDLLKLNDEMIEQVLCRALMAPIERLFMNCGFTPEEAKVIVDQVAKPIAAGLPKLMEVALPDGKMARAWNWEGVRVYDAYEQKLVDPWAGGVLDSTPAVLEALRNSLSIASLLGTCGGTSVYKRDTELERSEARDTNSFLRAAESENPADERAV